MNTVKNKTISKLEVKKSSFISILMPITNKEEAMEKLNQIKQDYPNAKHYLYAYLCDSTYYSDDKEPGSPGKAIATFLEYKNLNYVLLIVVRYFGGILLGQGNLVRTYLKSAKEVYEKSDVIPYILKKEVKITFPYELEKEVFHIIKKEDIKESKYEKEISLTLNIKEEQEEKLSKLNIKKEE